MSLPRPRNAWAVVPSPFFLDAVTFMETGGFPFCWKRDIFKVYRRLPSGHLITSSVFVAWLEDSAV